MHTEIEYVPVVLKIGAIAAKYSATNDERFMFVYA